MAAPSPVVVPMPLARSARPAPEPERIGDLLRRAREKRGEALEDIAGWLRIRPAFLAALEQSRYAELPAADAYVTGFLRSYAVYLGFDPKMAIERYRYEMAGQQRKTQLVLPQPLPEGRGPTLVVLLAAALAALLVYALWYSASVPERPAAPPAPPQLETTPPVAPAAEQQPAPVAAPAATAVPATGSPPAQAPVPAAVAPTPEPVATPVAPPAPVAATPAAPMPSVPAAVAPVPPAMPAPGPASIALPVPLSAIPTLDKTPPLATAPIPPVRAAVPEAKPAVAPPKDKAPSVQAASKPVPAPASGRMTIRAEQESWILVADPQGNTVYEKVLRPGETWRVPATKGLTLTTGNGGAVVVNLDGVDLPHFAEEGRVARGVPLDPDRLRARVPPPPRKQPEAPRDIGAPPAAGL